MDETKDYVDWSKVPIDYNVVVLQGPNWYAGENTARMYPNMDLVSCEDGDIWNGMAGDDAPADAIIGPLPPWRESLRQRPMKAGV